MHQRSIPLKLFLVTGVDAPKLFSFPFEQNIIFVPKVAKRSIHEVLEEQLLFQKSKNHNNSIIFSEAIKIRGKRRREPSSATIASAIASSEEAPRYFHGEKMLKKALFSGFSRKSASALGVFQFNQQRAMHSRNKKAMEFVAKGWSALKEVDRVIDHCELNDRRLIPLLRTAKENFELALEADNSNTHARYWLARLHLRYHVPGQNKAIGAALLVEAAEMGDPDAQYELGCRLRVKNEHVQSDQKAFEYLENAVDQLHPGALYLLGAVYLTGDCVKKDIASAIWCFHRASQKGHAGAAIAYGSLLLKGHEVPESLTKFSLRRGSAARRANKSAAESDAVNPVEMAKEKFQIAERAGCDLGSRWLDRIKEEEKRLLSETHNPTE